MSTSCVQRVWDDNGDMTDCGKSPTIGDTKLCEGHLRSCIIGLNKTIDETLTAAEIMAKERDLFSEALSAYAAHSSYARGPVTAEAAAARRRWFWMSFYSTVETSGASDTPQPFWSWMTGLLGTGQFTIVCLVEDVVDANAAWKMIRDRWPAGTITSERFCNEVERGYRPGDRFPGYVSPPEFAEGKS